MSEIASTTHSKFRLTDPRRFAIGRRIAKVDRDRHAVANGKLDRVQIIAEILIQPQHTFFDLLENLVSAHAIRFGSANETDVAARRA